MKLIAHLVLLIVAASLLECCLQTLSARLRIASQRIAATHSESQIADLEADIRQPAQYAVEAADRRNKFWDLLTDDRFVGSHPDNGEHLFKIPIDSLDATLDCGIRGSLPSSQAPTSTGGQVQVQAPNNIFVKKWAQQTLEDAAPLWLYVYCDDLENLNENLTMSQADEVIEIASFGLFMKIFDPVRSEEEEPEGNGNLGRYTGYIDKIAGVCPSLTGNDMVHMADSLYQCLRHEWVSLDDQSKLECPGGGDFRLGLLRSMQSGESWYQKFKFEYFGEDPNTLRKIQQDLHRVTVAELKVAVSECGIAELQSPFEPMAANVSAILDLRFDEYEQEGLTKFESARCKNGSAGHFAEWLIQKDCKKAEGTIRAALPLPCPNMVGQAGEGSSLWKATKFPELGGLMIKKYN